MKKIFTLFAVMLFALTVNATTPSTDFAGGYQFTADAASIDGNIEKTVHNEDLYLRYIDRDLCGTAEWEITCTTACFVTVTLNMYDNSWNYDEQERPSFKNGGHRLEVQVKNGDAIVSSIAEASESDAYNDIVLPGELYVPAGTFTIKLLNNRAWSKCGISGITFTKIAIPSTDFAGGYAFTGTASTSDAGIDRNEHYNTGENPYIYLRYTGSTSTSAKATWRIEATRACFVNVTINFADNTWNYATDNSFQNGKHILGVELYDVNNQRLDTIAEGAYENGSALDGYTTPNELTKSLGTIIIPAAGIYTVKLLNCRSWSKCGIKDITLTYVDDLRTLYLYPNMWSADGAKYALWCYDSSNSLASSWSKFMTLAEGETSIYSTIIPASYTTVNFVRLKSTATTPNWDDKMNQTANQTITDSKDYCVITAWGESGKDSPCTWKKYNSALEDGSYYLIGIINGVEGWNEEDLTPERKFTADASAEVEDRMSVTSQLVVNDRIKAVSIANKMIQYWYPNTGDGLLINSDHAGETKKVYLSPGGHGGTDWLNTVLFVPENGEPTAIDNTVVGEKAVKVFRDGMLLIEKNGKVYTVTGQIVR